MKERATLAVTRLFPLVQDQTLMAHVASGDLSRDWLGPVDLVCGARRIPMRCTGVGETGGEPVAMLRPLHPEQDDVERIAAIVGEPSSCALSIERTSDERPERMPTASDRAGVQDRRTNSTARGR